MGAPSRPCAEKGGPDGSLCTKASLSGSAVPAGPTAGRGSGKSAVTLRAAAPRRNCWVLPEYFLENSCGVERSSLRGEGAPRGLWGSSLSARI